MSNLTESSILKLGRYIHFIVDQTLKLFFVGLCSRVITGVRMPRFRFTPLIILFSLVTACDSNNGQAVIPPQEVGVMTLQSQSVGINESLSGRLESSRIAEVRARVTGIVEKHLFREGDSVKAGEALFQIDSDTFEAELSSAKAQKTKAEASLLEAKYEVERYQQLLNNKAVSEFEYLQAQTRYEDAKANLATAKSSLINAERNVEYAQVQSPIAGKIGRAFVTEGALVSETEATLLAKVQQTDPMYINLQQSSDTFLRRLQSSGDGQVKLKSSEQVRVILELDNGQHYAHQGKLMFSDIDVDTGTGQLLVRAVVPNPDAILLPGMFVRAHLTQASWTNAFLVPQKAVIRSERGDTVFIVDNNNMLSTRAVTIRGNVGDQWIVIKGLHSGEKLMVDGFQKARPGSKVSPVLLDKDSQNQGNQGKAQVDSVKHPQTDK